MSLSTNTTHQLISGPPQHLIISFKTRTILGNSIYDLYKANMLQMGMRYMVLTYQPNWGYSIITSVHATFAEALQALQEEIADNKRAQIYDIIDDN